MRGSEPISSTGPHIPSEPQKGKDRERRIRRAWRQRRKERRTNDRQGKREGRTEREELRIGKSERERADEFST